MQNDHDVLLRLDERQQTIVLTLGRHTDKLDVLDERIECIERQSQRWKGAAGMLLGLGLVLGWFLDRVLALWKSS